MSDRKSNAVRKQVRPIALRVSQFASAYNKTPIETHELTWDQFVEDLPDLLAVERRTKNALPALVYADVDGTLCNANVREHTALAIDVDRVPGGFLASLKRKRLRCVAYETPSSGVSTEKNPESEQRLRVVVSLTEPVPTHAVKNARTALARDLGLDPVKSGVAGADAIAQLMFAGRVRGTPERKMWAFDGKPWAPPPPGKAPADGPHLLRETAADRAPWQEAPDLSVLAEGFKQAHQVLGGPGKRKLCERLGSYLASRGCRPESIWERVEAVAPSRHGSERRADTARDLAERYCRGDHNATGWKDLVGHFGAETMASLEAATTDPWITNWLSRSPLSFAEAWRKANGVKRIVSSKANAKADFWTFDFTQNTEPPKMLCARLGLVKEGGRVNVIAGEPGKGKTWSAMALALAVASGKKVFGEFECVRGVVRHIDSDMGARTTMRRYGKLARGMGVDLQKITREHRIAVRGGVCLTSGGKPDPAAYEQLKAALDGVDLLVIDSLISVAPGIDENSSAFAEVVKNLMRVSDATNTTMLMLHHPGKSLTSKKGRGTSALDADWGAWWVLDAGGRWTQNKKHGDVDELSEPFVTTFEASGTVGERLSDGAGSVCIRVVESDESTDGEVERVAEVIASYGYEGCSQRDAEERLDGQVARDAVRGAIATLLRDQLCYREQGRKGSASAVIKLSDNGRRKYGKNES